MSYFKDIGIYRKYELIGKGSKISRKSALKSFYLDDDDDDDAGSTTEHTENQ